MLNPIKHTLIAAIIALTAADPGAQAAAPLSKTGVPGYARIMLGAFEITPLSDGTADLPMDQLLKQDARVTRKSLEKNFLALPVETSTNAFLVNTGTKLVLIDTGSGAFFGPTLGKVGANLKAAGYQPEQVDEIYITHLHPDHVGGLSADGKRLFPNAVLRAGKPDVDYWLSTKNEEKAPQDKKGFFQPAMLSVNPYIQAGKFRAIESDGELVPGIAAVAAPGHTPGHTIYIVQSQGQKLILVGDLIHVASVQMDNPQVTIGFDSDEKQAYASRRKQFDTAAGERDLIGGAHLQFPGLGHLVKEGKGYRWVPVNYMRQR